jgi:hypothetical protein
MMLRFTMSQYEQQDPGDLILEADDISAVLEGEGKDNSRTCMLYTRFGMQFHVRDDDRDTQDRVMKARGDLGTSV